jgi:hypothetical protein
MGGLGCTLEDWAAILLAGVTLVSVQLLVFSCIAVQLIICRAS